jgi:hypothetical protein
LLLPGVVAAIGQQGPITDVVDFRPLIG